MKRLPGSGEACWKGLACLLVLVGGFNRASQLTAVPNRDLSLDGQGSYVALPPSMFTNLHEATVEAWVKIDQFLRDAHFIDFGEHRQEMYLAYERNEPNLKFLITDARRNRHRLVVPNLLQRDQWFHVAAVTGPGGARLYFNGILVKTNEYAGSLADLGQEHNYLGRSNSSRSNPAHFRGQLDEVRVWRVARSEGQIRRTMYGRLSGSESNLVGLWTFDDGTARDSGRSGHHGKLMGNARVAAARLPTEQELPWPAWLTGTITNPAGEPVASARVFLQASGAARVARTTDSQGRYQMPVYATDDTCRLLVVQQKQTGRSAPFPVRPGERYVRDLTLGDTAQEQEPLAIVSALLPALQDKHCDTATRRQAVLALRDLEASDLETVTVLTAALADADSLVRDVALSVLQRVPVPDSLHQVYEKRARAMAYLFSGLLIPFAVFHLLLFVFFPKNAGNLYFAAYAGAAAWMNFLPATGENAAHGASMLLLSAVLSLLGLRLLYAFFYSTLPKTFWAFFGLAAITSAGVISLWDQFEFLAAGGSAGLPIPQGRTFLFLVLCLVGVSVLALLTGVEMIRVIILALIRRKRGAWIIGLGFLTFLFLQVISSLSGVFIFRGPVRNLLGDLPPDYLPDLGVVVFVGCASLYLARDFAQTSRGFLKAKEEIESKNLQLAAAKEAAEAAKDNAENARFAADEANQAKSRFLANMSHELRTPLNAIIGYSEMLQEEVAEIGQAALQPDLERIHTAGRHLLSLINDVLDLSKIEAGKMTLYLEEFDVAKMVREVTATVEPLVSKNHNTLEVDCPPHIGAMRADLTKVRQTLFNLLSNAAKFTENGAIRLEVQGQPALGNPAKQDEGGRPEDRGRRTETGIQRPEVGGRGAESLAGSEAAESDAPTSDGPSRTSVLFRVSDTGIGISAEQMARLFAPFSQADPSTTRKYGGTGLGLTISRKFCQLMGGDLTAKSELGRGSVFTVRLPVTVRNPSSPPPLPPPADAPRPSSQPPKPSGPDTNLLVIDDDPAVRDLMARTLTKEGFRVETAATGAEGMALARRLKPAVITLDVLMPGQDGWSVLATLKADPVLCDIPVIMLTIVDDRNIGFSLGAAEYFTKPIHWPRLTAVLRRYRKTQNQATVLVVDDEDAVRKTMQRALEKEGWHVTLAENGRRALETLRSHLPQLILLDLLMPEMDGFEFLQALRQRTDAKEVPVMIMTAKDITEDDRHRLHDGVARILQKSHTTPAQVLGEIRSLLGRETMKA